MNITTRALIICPPDEAGLARLRDKLADFARRMEDPGEPWISKKDVHLRHNFHEKFRRLWYRHELLDALLRIEPGQTLQAQAVADEIVKKIGNTGVLPAKIKEDFDWAVGMVQDYASGKLQ